VILQKLKDILNVTSIALISCPIAEFDGEKIFCTGQDAYNDTPQLGIYALAGAFREFGCDVELVDLVHRNSTSVRELIDLVSAADIFCFSSNAMNWATVSWVASQLQHFRPASRFMCGGPHCTLFPEEVSSTGLFDVVWKGDSLHAVPHILKTYSGSISRSKTVEIVDGADVSGQAFYAPAFDLLPDKEYRVIPVETSRGCKFQCTFCSIPKKKSWIPFDVSESVRRIESSFYFIEATTEKRISIVDDTFTSDRQRSVDIFESLDKERYAKRIFFDATAVDLLDERFVEAVTPFTCDLLVGGEVSNEEDAKRIRKAATPHILHRAAKNLMNCDLSGATIFSFIIGFPWQNREDCLRTLEFASEMIVDYGVSVYLQWYWPIPGSEIWRSLNNEGLASLDDVSNFGFFRDKEMFYRIRGMSADDVDDIDERIANLQLVFAATHGGRKRQALSYSPPPIGERVWMSSRRAS
jgi:radical SAM superfamily enzyme YgiQ (UPF0313 family)